MTSNPNLNSTLTKKLNIVYWNCRSFQPRRQEIDTLLPEVDILVCVETWLKPNINVQFTGFITIRQDRIDSRGGGIIFIVRKNLGFAVINNLSNASDNVEVFGIHVNGISPAFNLIACYRTPGFTLSQNEWDVIFSNLKDNDHTILVGDFNAHNKNWNCKYSDTNGRRLENCITSLDHVMLHNTDSFTHIDFYRNLKSNIDLIFILPIFRS